MEIAQAKIVIEAALLSSVHPLNLGELRKLFDNELPVPMIESALAAGERLDATVIKPKWVSKRGWVVNATHPLIKAEGTQDRGEHG